LITCGSIDYKNDKYRIIKIVNHQYLCSSFYFYCLFAEAKQRNRSPNELELRSGNYSSFFFLNLLAIKPSGLQTNKKCEIVPYWIILRTSSLNLVPFKTLPVAIITVPHIIALAIIVAPGLKA
jgi:hypothetical protein